MAEASNGFSATGQNECLIDIEESDLRLLYDLYRDNEQNPYAASLLINGLRIKEMIKGYPIKFMSPLGVSKDSGTFIAVIEFNSYVEVGVFTLSPEFPESCNDAVFSGLNFTKRINFESTKRPTVFKELHSGLRPIVTRTIKKRHLQTEKEEIFHVFKMTKDEALQLEISNCEDVSIELRTLDAMHAFTVNGHWPHYYPTGEDVVRTLVDVNGGYGIFRKSNNQLLAWGLKTMMGQIGFVQTLEPYRRKGYATMIVKTFAKEFASEGIHPVAIVTMNDTVSHNFFENIGFKKVGICYNIYLKKRTDSIASDNEDAGEGSSKT